MSVLYWSLKEIKHFLVRLLIIYKVKTEFLLVPFKNPTLDFTIQPFCRPSTAALGAFHLSRLLLRCFLHLVWSPLEFIWTWFGQTCIFCSQVGHNWVKTRHQNCLQSAETGLCCGTDVGIRESSWEHSDLHHHPRKEVWNNQDSTKWWPSKNTMITLADSGIWEQMGESSRWTTFAAALLNF